MSDIKLGFTGTRNGMTPVQKQLLASWMSVWQLTQKIVEAHHGCCVGGDDEFHELCLWFGIKIILHPPTETKLVVSKHFLDVDPSDIRAPLPYLKRNQSIVDECDFLLAAPPTMIEEMRGGTWSTVRYARKIKREHRVMLPE